MVKYRGSDPVKGIHFISVEFPKCYALISGDSKSVIESHAQRISAASDMMEVLETIENDAGQVPMFLWKRIQEVLEKAGSKFARDPESEDYVPRCNMAAAAPEMLEALESVAMVLQGALDCNESLNWRDMTCELDIIKLAIAKAKGGSCE